MVFSDKVGNCCAFNAVATSKKYLDVGHRDLCAISICSTIQPQLRKQLQCKLKCNILQLAAILLFCKKLYLNLQIIVGT